MSSNSTADQLKEKGSIILQKTGTVAKQGFDKASTLTKQGITQGMDFGKSEVKLSGWSIYVIGGVILTLFILVFVFAFKDTFTSEPMADYGGTQRRYIQPDHLGSDGKSLVEDYNKDLKVQPNYSS
jgi:hypothetical protein